MTDIPALRPPHESPTIDTVCELTRRWRALMGPLGFSHHRLWLLLLDPDGRVVPHVVQIDDIPPAAGSSRCGRGRKLLHRLAAQRDPVPITVRMVKDDTACTPQSPTGGNVPFEGRTVGKVVVTTGAPDEDGNVEVRAEVRFRLAHRRPRADVRLNLVHLGDPLVTGCTTLDHEKTKKRHSQRLTLTARVPADSVLQVSVWRGSSSIKASELF